MQNRHAKALLATLAALSVLSACGDSNTAQNAGTDPSGTAPQKGQGTDDFKTASTVLKHNFGTLAHGSSAQHDFKIPMDRRHGDLVPVLFQVPCACASSKFVIVGEDGSERIATGQPTPQYAVKKGEKLILRVTLDTSQREAHDEAETGISGVMVLQTANPPHRRRNQSIQFRFGIDSPVDIRPYAHLDIKQIPRSRTFNQTFELHYDDPKTEFGDVRCIESSSVPGLPKTAPDLTARIEQEKDHSLLHISFKAAPERQLGAFMIQVKIDTNLSSGYVLRLPVSGTLIGDIQLSPPGVFSYGQHPLDQKKKVFLNITDFDKSHSADFVVSSLVDTHGVDISSHFAVQFEPIPTKPRSRRIQLTYLGTLADRSSIRGKLNLSKRRGAPHIQSIDITAFNRQ